MALNINAYQQYLSNVYDITIAIKNFSNIIMSVKQDRYNSLTNPSAETLGYVNSLFTLVSTSQLLAFGTNQSTKYVGTITSSVDISYFGIDRIIYQVGSFIMFMKKFLINDSYSITKLSDPSYVYNITDSPTIESTLVQIRAHYIVIRNTLITSSQNQLETPLMALSDISDLIINNVSDNDVICYQFGCWENVNVLALVDVNMNALNEQIINQVNEIQNDVNDLQNNYILVDSSINDLENCCIEVRNDINNLQNDVNDLQNNYILVDSSINDLENCCIEVRSDVNVINSSINDLENSINQIVIGTNDNPYYQVNNVNYSIQESDYIIGVNSTTSPVVLTLPSIASLTLKHKMFFIKDEKLSAHLNNISIVRSGSDLFEDGSTTLLINASGTSIHLYSDGTSKWYLC